MAELTGAGQALGTSRAVSKNFQKSVHYLRGIAALGVLLTHAGVHLERTYQVSWARSIFPDFLAIYGVAIFFAISGYLMATLVVRQPPFEFLARRILRIYPTFLVATAIALLVLPPVVAQKFEVLSATLLPIGTTSYALAVEWTLVHELFFYVALFVCVLFGLTRCVAPIGALWLVAIIGSALFGSTFPRIGHAHITEVGLMLGNFGFAAGLLIPSVTKRLRSPLLFLLLALIAATVTYSFGPKWPRIIAGLASVFLLTAAVQSTVSLPVFVHVALSKLGDWSYALYLSHITVIYTVFHNIGYHPATILIATGLAILVSAVLGELDLLLHGLARKLVANGRTARVLAVLVSAFVICYFAIGIWREFGAQPHT